MTLGISGDPVAHFFMGMVVLESLVPDDVNNYWMTVMKTIVFSACLAEVFRAFAGLNLCSEEQDWAVKANFWNVKRMARC